jgi:hypothetical protein
MRRAQRLAWTGAIALLMGGCASGPLLDNPIVLRPTPETPVDNPMYVPLGPVSYGNVMEKVISVITEYFEIRYSNRYSGEIITFPRISPGLEQPWKRGSPDLAQRFEATLQTIRHRAEVKIDPAPDGGFFVSVTIYKELEDLPRPLRATAGAASFRTDNPLERQFEVVDPGVFESSWIPLGRDLPMEQAVLHRIKKCM